MGFGKSTSTSSPKLNHIEVQSSTLGLPLSIGWGRNRIKCNLIWYGDFKAIAHTTKQSGGKGLGGSSTNTTYTYTASVVMALGEGVIPTVRTVYKDTSVLSGLFAAGLSLATGTETQTPWSYLASRFPAQALSYPGIAYVYAQDYALSDSATLANHSFEVDFAIQLGGGIPDADPRDIVTDFLTNARYGIPGWQGGLLGDLGEYSTYCRANNLLLSPALESQQAANSTMTEWFQATNSAPFWSEGVLKVRPFGDTAATGNGSTFTPDLTPEYDLTEDDFSPEEGEPPVVLSIRDQSDAYNIVQVEFLDRANQYNTAIATAQDLDNIIEFGPRKMDPITLHCICDASIAQKVAQLILQRVLYVRDTYKFRLPWNFARLEAMDLVTLSTDTDELQLDRLLVRILSCEEDEGGLLTFEAEPLDIGIAAAAQYSSHSADGYQINADVPPGSVASPVLFLAPTELTGFDSEIWLAVAAPGEFWGGCEVWISPDGTNYSYAGRVEGPARYGVLTAALPSGSDPDTTHSLQVDLSASSGALEGGTAAEMNAGGTMALVDSELVAYQNATLTSPFRYSLSPLRRGQRSTEIASHSLGAPFVRLDDAVFKLGFDASVVGQTIHVKLPSFNIFGKALEDLADVVSYSITLPSAQSRYLEIVGEIDGVSAGLIALGDDGVLTTTEKFQKLIPLNTEIANTYSLLSTKAAELIAFGVVATAKAAADAAWTAWTTYRDALSPAWNNIALDTAVVRATYDGKISDLQYALDQLADALRQAVAVSAVNRLINTRFEQGFSGWAWAAGANCSIVAGYPQIGTNNGSQYLLINSNVTAASADNYFIIYTDALISVRPGERLAVQVGHGTGGTAVGGAGRTDLNVQWFDAAGAIVSEQTVASDDAPTDYGTLLRGFVTVPEGISQMRVPIYFIANGSAGTLNGSITQPMVSSASPGQTEFPPFVPGAWGGAQGAPGIDGAPGAPGAPGITYYDWYAYADSPDGTVNFSVGDPGDRGYQGVARNKTTPTESSSPTDYTWSPYRGPPGFGLANRAGMAISSNKIVRSAVNTGLWDASVISTESATGGCQLTFRLGPTGLGDYGVGINTDPATNDSWETIDYLFVVRTGGGIEIFESGASIASVGTYAEGTTCVVAYDGRTVRYSVNGSVVRTVAASPGQTYWLDSAFSAQGATAYILGWGPAGAAGSDGEPGAPGDPGAPGIDALSAQAAPNPVSVPCTANGTPKGALGTAQITAIKGITDVTASASYVITASSNVSDPAVSSSGVVSISGIGGGAANTTGSVSVTVSKDGASAKVVATWSKTLDGASYVNDSTGIAVPPSTSYSDCGQVALLMGPNGTINLDANGDYDVSSGIYNIEGYVDYSLNGGGSWTMVTGSTFTHNQASSSTPGNFFMTTGINGVDIGLSAKQTVLFRAMLRRSAGTSPSSFGGSMNVEWKG